MFGWGKKKHDQKEPEPGKPAVIKSLKMTETVKADLQQNIQSLKEIGPGDFDAIYNAAVRALDNGASHILCQALMTREGMTKRRAEDITRSLSFKANALMIAEQQERLGIKYAIWLYSGAPCGDPDQDVAHKAANGKPYLVSKGMFLSGKWTRPGRDDGCRCVSRPLIAGFDGYDGGKPEGFVE